MSITQFCGVFFEYHGPKEQEMVIFTVANLIESAGVFGIVQTVRVDQDDNTVAVFTKNDRLCDEDFGKLKSLAEALRGIGWGFDILNRISFCSDEPEKSDVSGESGQAADNIGGILAERGARYGEFDGHAKYTQDMKRIFQSSPNWGKMTDAQRESMEMVAHKFGRVLNGDPDYLDSWVDVEGYARLAVESMEKAKQS